MSVLAALALLLGLVWGTLRRPFLLPLHFAPALVGLAVASAVAGSVFGTFSLSFTVLLSGVLVLTAEYGPHVILAASRVPLAPGSAVRGVRLPVWMAALAAAGSAAALLSFPSPQFIPYLVCGICGVLSAGGFAALVLPGLIPATGRKVRTPVWDLDAWAAGVERWGRAQPRLVAMGTLLLLLLSAWGLSSSMRTGDPAGISTLARVCASIGLAGLLVYLATLRLEWALVTVLSQGTMMALTLGSLAWLNADREVLRWAAPVLCGLGANALVFRIGGVLAGGQGREIPAGSLGFAALELLAAAGALVLSGHALLSGLGAALAVGILWSLCVALLGVPALMRPFLPTDPARPPETLRTLLGGFRSTPPAPGACVAEDRTPTERAVRREIRFRYTYLGARVEQYTRWKLTLDPVYALAAARLPKAGLILDLGCGYGLMSHWAAITGPQRRIFGVDRDVRKLAVAHRTERFERRISFQPGDLLDLDLPPAAAGLLLDILHYSGPDLQVDLLRKAASALVPGGTLVVCETCLRPGELSWAEVWDRFSMRIGFNPDQGGVHLADRSGWQHRFTQAGLNVEAMDPCGASRCLFLLKRTR